MNPLEDLCARYREYVDTFRRADGTLPEMMELKRIHTDQVVANAEAIVEGEAFEPVARETAVIAALLHDTGRYEQLRRYGTFRDAESVNHAALSHDIVRALGWLEAAGLSAERAASVLEAVRDHNLRELPTGLDALTEAAANVVRDADKLDIFRVLEGLLSRPDWREDRTAYWDVPIDAPASPAVLAALEGNRAVDYRDIHSLADFILVQIGWMRRELVYATTRRLCRERGHLAFRRRFLANLTHDSEIDRLCAETERHGTNAAF